MAQNPENLKPRFSVKINGSQLQPEAMVDLLSATVSDCTDGADMFSITINIWDARNQRLKWLDDGMFDEGNEVEVRLGYIDNMEQMMIGEIVAIDAGFPESDARSMIIQGYDRLHRFRRGNKSRSFKQMKDSQIAEQIAGELQLQVQADDSEIVHDYIFQNNQTDIDFLLERARRIRYEVAVKDRTLFFKKVANAEGPNTSIEYGHTLQSFYPRLTTIQQVSEVLVKGWNPLNKESITGRAQTGDEVPLMDGARSGSDITAASFGEVKTFVVDMPIYSQAEADQIALAVFNDCSLNFVIGEGTAIGNTGIRAGRVVELKKLGRRFSGLYYVVSSTHVIDKQGYITKFKVKRNAT